MKIDGISNIAAASNISNITERPSNVNEQVSGASFFHVLKDMASKETLIFRTDNGNIGGLVNTVNSSPEDISKVLSEQKYVKIEQNPDLPSHLKNVWA